MRNAMLLGMLFVLCACGNSSDKKSEGGPVGPAANRVNWAAIPSEYNPTIDAYEIAIGGVEKIDINLFGFDRDVDVTYSNELRASAGTVRVYKVMKGMASWGSVSSRVNGRELEVGANGRYECSIKISNGAITALEGGCYVRIEVVLPTGAEIEVYNMESLVSKRFFAMSTADFLEKFDRASFDNEKFAVIEEFVATYAGLSRKPSLTCDQLKLVVKDFPFAESKYKALRSLQAYVSDRQNLGEMIEDSFSYFERDEARRIVGL